MKTSPTQCMRDNLWSSFDPPSMALETFTGIVSSSHHCSDFLPLLNSYSVYVWSLYLFFLSLEIWEVVRRNTSSTPWTTCNNVLQSRQPWSAVKLLPRGRAKQVRNQGPTLWGSGLPACPPRLGNLQGQEMSQPHWVKPNPSQFWF